MAGAHYVNANMGYDLQRDFTPVSLIETSPWSFVAGSHLPARTVQEFIALARSQPGKLTYGTIGAGQIPYWSVRMFNSMNYANATRTGAEFSAGLPARPGSGRSEAGPASGGSDEVHSGPRDASSIHSSSADSRWPIRIKRSPEPDRAPLEPC